MIDSEKKRITAEMVKKVRDRMEAEHGWYLGLRQTKLALEAENGDEDAAIERMRRSGLSGRRA